MKPPAPKPLRCAIYTRVSTEHGLEQEFNSLDNQREAAEAYIKSQAHEGWRLILARYDDGGYSGGSMERPALQQLLSDIKVRQIDVVVVYKVDRLTRSLADFVKLVELFDEHGVSFVSVTQAFNTTTSMGRLTLNVLLSFAQFEREVTGERIRDKIAASKRKGMRMGGPVPLGYEVRDKKLVIHDGEAERVRLIFSRYLELGCLTKLAEDLRIGGIMSKTTRRKDGSVRGGIPFTKGPLAHLLGNRVYIGEIVHKGRYFKGEHEPLVDREMFAAVQARRHENRNGRLGARFGSGSLLVGRIYDDRNNRMTPSHAQKHGARYRYYVSCVLAQGRKDEAGTRPRVPAPEIEAKVVEQLRMMHTNRLIAAGENAADHDLIESALEKVVVHQNELEIVLKEVGEGGPRQAINVPWTPAPHRRRREIIGDSGDPAHSGAPISAAARAKLLLGIARARHWVNEIVSGEVFDPGTIAEREQMSERSIRMSLSLAFLSPDLVKAAIDGTLRRGFGLCWLTQMPASWSEQRRVLSGL